MSLSDKLRARKADELALQHVRRMEPLETLGVAILAAADRCSRIVTRRGESGSVASAADIAVFWEFLSFFLHITMREALELQFDRAKMDALRDHLGPPMANAAVNAFCRNWPEDRKSKLRSDFFEKLNEDEVQYAKCTPRLMVSDDDTTHGLLATIRAVADGREPLPLLGQLVRDVAEVAGHPHNPETMIVALTAAVDALGEARLKERVAGARRVL